MDTTTTTTTSSPDHASSSVAKSFKRPRRVVQFDDKAEEILVPNKPIFEKTEWIGWHTHVEKKSFEREIKDTIKAYKRAKRDRREVPSGLCFRGIEDHLSSRTLLYRKSRIHEHVSSILLQQEQRRRDFNGSRSSCCVNAPPTTDWALQRALKLGQRDAMEAAIHSQQQQQTLIGTTVQQHEEQQVHVRKEPSGPADGGVLGSPKRDTRSLLRQADLVASPSRATTYLQCQQQPRLLHNLRSS
mmetsp:Transcript_24659/g.57464  ORF Transcript_24659/g.57464 Transcript_24659/m.57464 type:complete len:243 (+) Transcript_24659:280-1008(+)